MAGLGPGLRSLKTLQDADLRIANLECVIATGGSRAAKPWTFRAHPQVFDSLRRHVDVVSLANNHSGDFGPTAFTQMLGRLQKAGLPYFGGGTDLWSAHRPAIIERQGLRIALLGYNEMFPRRFEAGPDSPGVAWADEEQIVADIRGARTQADIVIPYMHWGQEHSETSHARQRALARLMIRAGADAVVGTHPHVRQDRSEGSIEGELRELTTAAGSIELRFAGDVRSLSRGEGAHARNLLPTWLEWLRANQWLTLVWASGLTLFGLAAAVDRWWRNK